ncbi:MAG: 2OG-Fe(II) oxygenase [Hyphomicrobiales bacterium]|nr:2OG-Fe(II) oxygenase [Hyphomicrobiales bacterium]
MPYTANAIAASFCSSARKARHLEKPYPHAFLSDLFPAAVARELNDLPFKAPSLGGVSGKRELHNDTRSYFDAAAMARFPVMAETAQALQSPSTIATLEDVFGAPLAGTFLRLEYAQDIDGFWLEPHTDLGVKRFTCLIYLSALDGHDTLGTDIYSDHDTYFGRSPFIPNSAMVFVPGTNTWHGFEKRPINGVRKSVILNYVTTDWRAREQLSFPQTPVHR